MSTHVHLRVVTPDLFAQWKRLRNSLYTDLDPAQHEHEMEVIHSSADQACFVAASADDKLLGFIEVSLRNLVDGCDGSPVGYIEGLFVTPNRRRQGIGAALMARAADWFRESGCSAMATDSELDDAEAQAYWQRIGFDEIWRIVQFRKAL